MSTHSSFKKAQRASKRFTATRETLQIDPREHHLPDVVVNPVPYGTDGKFRLAIDDSTDNICDLKDLADRLKTEAMINVTVLEGMLNSLLDILPKFIAEGSRSVRIGNLVTLKPIVTGSIDHPDDKLDPDEHHLEIRATVSPALRHSIAKTKLINSRSGACVIDFVISDADGAVRNVVDGVHSMIVNGRGFYVPENQAEIKKKVRVWIETPDGEHLGECKVSSGGYNAIFVKFVPEKPVEVDEVKVCVKTYLSREAADSKDKSSLLTVSRVVKFRKEPYGK